MKKLLLSLLAIMVLGGNMQAQATSDTSADAFFSIGDVEITPGGEATAYLKLDMQPEGMFVKAVQFDLYLPDHITVSNTQDPFVGTSLFDIKISSEQSYASYFTISPGDQGGNVFGQHVEILVYSVTANTIPFIVGKNVLEIKLKADNNFSGVQEAIVAGKRTSQPIDVTAFVMNPYKQHPMTQAPFKFKIKAPIELSEDKNYPEGFDEGLTNVNVTMNTRTLKANTWNTICLPFGMDKDQIAAAFPDNNVTIAELTGCTPNADNTHLSLKFTSISADAGIEANKPYLIKVSTGVTTFTVNGTSFAVLDEGKDNPEVEVDGCKFIGNYTNLSNLDKVIFISGNKFYVAQGNTSLKSFRGYFTHPILESSGNANVSLFVDDEPTGISTLTTNQDSNNIYDISGRKVNSDKTTLQKGIYITNGKKETVR